MLNTITNDNNFKPIQSEFPSISKMSKDQINPFKKVNEWVQNRTLFNEKSSWDGGRSNNPSLTYWGGVGLVMKM